MDDCHIHPVRLHGKVPVTIPANHKCCLMGDVRLRKNTPNVSFVLEPNEHDKLPGGLFLETALIDIPYKAKSKVPVVLQNLSGHSIVLQPGSTLAQVCVAQHISPLAPVSNASSHDKFDGEKLKFNLDESPISEEWKERITTKLKSISEVFAVDDLSYGHTTVVKHHIRLIDDTPFKERSRPIHPNDREAVKQHLKELLNAGVIRESESPYASPIVVVRKKDGSIRLCVDYRKLNARTIRDAYALPNIEETFTALSGAKWFSVMDLKSGYYQVEMAEEDKAKTAFVCPLGFYEFNRLPQGVTNAPSMFQRLMEKCVGDLNLSEVLVFLDDLIVFSDTLEEHEVRLMRVLNRLRDFGLKLSPEKCHFFRPSVKYLGHVVDAQGAKWDPLAQVQVAGVVLEIKKTQSSLEAQDSQRVWAVQGSHSPLMIGPALQGMQSCQKVGAAQDPLPILEAEGIQPENANHKSHSEYVNNLRQRLEESYTLAAKNSQRIGERNKARFDKRIRVAELCAGDRVLVRNMSIRGKHKISDRWEQKVHVVVKRINDGPVYVVEPELGDGPKRTLHRDLLLPCGFLPVEEIAGSRSHGPSKGKKLRNKAEIEVQSSDGQEDEVYSDEDEMYPAFVVPEIITRGPFIQTERQVIIPQLSTGDVHSSLPRAEPQDESHAQETPSHVSEPGPLLHSDSNEVTTSPIPSDEGPGWVVIDIPEQTEPVEMNQESSDTAEQSSEPETVELRRSGRERRQPRKLTYDELGFLPNEEAAE
ncbi:uncharacterized protein LOC118455412 [Neolamprologus brichardi]|uniref:uncharacterized protein LOC118455412 n=1 Tax=Neolamprologus brichardi TaxID=32507 RepID=UPI001643C336|nr:uncharacterized protein LOC118455412 [Neolamprologus brichardi]